MKKLAHIIDQACTYLLIVFVFAMMIFSLTAIIGRYFSFTFMWIDPLVRHLVFASAFLGGVLAIGQNKHIKIDILSKYFEYKNSQKALEIYTAITLLICTILMFWLAKAGVQFYQEEAQYGREVFWGIHSSLLTAIIPAGFSLMIIRGLLTVLLSQGERK